jgi:AraC family transcriptional regulator
MNYTQILKEITEYIEDSIEKPLTLDEISEKFYISKFHLHRIFKFYTRSTLGQYVAKRRFQFIGDEILEKRELEVWKIALKYSYTQPQSMNRVFKKYYNCTPLQYRDNNERIIIQKKLNILDKETVSLKGKPIMDMTIEYFDEEKLYGYQYTINLEEYSYDEEKIFSFTKDKYLSFKEILGVETVFYISIKQNSTIRSFGVFTDVKLDFEESFVIPAGLFAVLNYNRENLYDSLDIVQGDIQSIFEKESITHKTEKFRIIQKISKENLLNNLIYIPLEVDEKG